MISSRLQALPTTRARFSRRHRLGGGEDHRLDPAHPFAPARRRRQVFEFRSSSPWAFGSAPSLRARRAGTSRVRSVRGSRRAQPAGRTAVARARSEICPPILADALRESSSSSASSAPGAPLARSFGAASCSVCARRPSSADRSHAPRRRLGVGEHDGALGAVGEIAPHAPTAAARTKARRARGARTAISAAAPARSRRARPRAARPPLPGRQATGARRPTSERAAARPNTCAAANGAGRPPSAQASAASRASCSASSCGTPKAAAAAAKDERQCPTGRADKFPPGERDAVPRVRDRRPAG